MRHLDRTPETRRAELGTKVVPVSVKTDQLSADQCSSQYHLLGRTQPETITKGISLIKFMNPDRYAYSECSQVLVCTILYFL